MVHLGNAGARTGTARAISAGPCIKICGCFLLLVLLGWIDYITGYELGFFVFYSVPVGLAAWYVGRWPAVAVALGASVSWWLADYYSGAKYSAPFYYYWNGTIHFLAFLINAVTIAKIKSDLDRRHALAAELESTRQALRSLAAQIPNCPNCGQPRLASSATAGTEHTFAAGEGPEQLANVLCESCRSTKERPPARAVI